MQLDTFLSEKTFDNIDKRLKAISNEIERNSYNLFTLSSYNSYLENFHSDIIRMLLDPYGKHGANDAFLRLFLEFLSGQGAALNVADYTYCEVTREVGKIDIWIKDRISKRSIIIENKINNAVDTENQLENYFNYASAKGFVMDAVVYLTLNGVKNAPVSCNAELNAKIINLCAFTGRFTDLVNGWLQKCYDLSADEDNRSFIFQYLKLLKHLSQMGLDRQIKDDFYALISHADGFQKAKAIAELVAGLEEYRADRFFMRINNDYLPFRKTYRWRPNHWLFENFNDGGIVFKLDVHFDPGCARIDFWNPHQLEEVQRNNVSSKLKTIGLLEEFSYEGFGGGLFKSFALTDFDSIESVDEALYRFVRDFFDLLRS